MADPAQSQIAPRQRGQPPGDTLHSDPPQSRRRPRVRFWNPKNDYLLKVRCANTLQLDELLSQQLKQKFGVARTRTIIVLATAKESVNLL